MPTPPCPYFGSCGGCSAQHIEYDIQVRNKRDTLAAATGVEDIKVFIGGEYFYRNRMDLIFHRGGIGFREKGKWQSVVDIERCVISNERLNILIKEIREFFHDIDAFDIRKCSGTFRYAVIRTPQEDSAISFVLNADSTRLAEAIEQIKAFAEMTTANNIIITRVPAKTDISTSDDYFVVKGSEYLKETYLGKQFVYHVQGFFQNNTEMTLKMQEYVHNILKSNETKDAHLLDLYGGVGTFGIINAPLFKGVTIIESVEQAIDAANKNITINNATNAKAIVLDAMQLKKVDLPKPLFVITDPPRTGMHLKTIEALHKLKPQVMIYISCNVEQLVKELPKFTGYTIKSVALFDLFPQTTHSESVVELVLKS